MREEEIQFSPTRRALALRLFAMSALQPALTRLALNVPRSAIVLVGGAAGLEAQHMAHAQSVLRVIAETAESLRTAIIDGGTQSGIMALMGKIYAEGKFRFPLIGVAVERMVRWPGFDNPEAHEDLEPFHTHFIIVPGNTWGDESAWLSESARVLSQGRSSLTLLINGGKISRQDVNLSLQAGRPVLVISGTGRLADELAESPASHLLHVVAADDSAALSSKLHALLTRS